MLKDFKIRISAAIFLVLGFYLILPLRLYAQDSLRYFGEVRATLSVGEHSPFWLVSNKYGMSSPEKNYGFVRAAIFHDINPSKRFSWGAGADLVAGWKLTTPFSIHQLYGEVKYRRIYAMAGSKEIKTYFTDSELSSGGLFYSGNAMPIPQVRIGTYGFAPFWGTKEWFSVKAYISFGKFTDSRWQKSWVHPGDKRAGGVLLNMKGLWLRGGNPEKFPLTADVGIEMATQFAGTIYKNGEIIKMPSNFKAWWKAVIPSSGGSDTPDDEQTNVQGNMLGTYYISLAWTSKADWSIKAYFQHYFEDQSQMTFEYGWKDALWGVEFKLPHNRFLSKFVYEYIYMKDQTGAVNHNWQPEIPYQVSGRDNYYNHYLYPGWQNWGMAIGTPLAISPVYNVDHSLNFYNTRFIGNHFGLEGQPLDEVKWRMLFTFTQNWGTYLYPLPNVLNNFSGLIEADYHPVKLKGWYGKLGIAWDSGKLLGNNFGVMLTIGKEGFISFGKKK